MLFLIKDDLDCVYESFVEIIKTANNKLDCRLSYRGGPIFSFRARKANFWIGLNLWTTACYGLLVSVLIDAIIVYSNLPISWLLLLLLLLLLLVLNLANKDL